LGSSGFLMAVPECSTRGMHSSETGFGSRSRFRSGFRSDIPPKPLRAGWQRFLAGSWRPCCSAIRSVG
jgi:hypothetical protein